jgi:hypothetical protein
LLHDSRTDRTWYFASDRWFALPVRNASFIVPTTCTDYVRVFLLWRQSFKFHNSTKTFHSLRPCDFSYEAKHVIRCACVQRLNTVRSEQHDVQNMKYFPIAFNKMSKQMSITVRIVSSQ